MVIIVKKNDQEREFSSWNVAKRELTGSTTGANAEACKRAITKAGWSIIKAEGGTTTTRGTDSLISKIVNQASTIDKALIKELEAERNALASTMKDSKDVNKLLELNNKITEASSPKINRDDIVAWFTDKLDEYLSNKEEA